MSGRWIERLVVFDEREARRARILRGFYKWILDFLRNAMVVAALAYLAVKSGSKVIWTMTAVADFALCAYCYTYIDIWAPHPDLMARGVIGKIIASVFVLIIQLLLVIVTVAIFFALGFLVGVQPR